MKDSVVPVIEDELETIQLIKELIRKQFGIDPEVIELDAPFAEYNVDSLGMAELAFSIEDHFGIHFAEQEFGRVTTLAGLLALVRRLMSENNAR